MAEVSTPLTKYTKVIAPKLAEELKVKNPMALPRIVKVKVSVGAGKIARKAAGGNMDDAKIKTICENVAAITGQYPVINNSRKAISNFKLRAGMPIGVSVTLRGEAAYNFIEKLVKVAFPRVRDFRGIPGKSFDGNGNYSVGIKDHTIFPEIHDERTEFTHGMEITVVTSTAKDASAKALLTHLGFPFINPSKK